MIRVLVVDDDAAIRSFVLEALSDEGYAVTAAADGQAALDQCRESPPDLVLLDLRMPVLDGFQFLSCRQDVCTAPVIVMSAGFRINQVTPEMNVAGFLEKPFDLAHLAAAVKKGIGPVQAPRA